jgi:hypothetical protein
MERGFILERRRAGIDAVRKRGAYKDRKPSVPVDAGALKPRPRQSIGRPAPWTRPHAPLAMHAVRNTLGSAEPDGSA